MMTTRCFVLPINHEGYEDHEDHEHVCGFQHERGSALIGVLLLLMMMSALVAALAVSGRTETFISRNQYSGAQAQAAAEAGLNHAVELATTYIFEWKANGFGDVEEALDALLVGPDGGSGITPTAEDMSLGARDRNLDGIWEINEAEAIPLFLGPPYMPIADGINAGYEAFIMDDDANLPPGDPENDGVADSPFNDENDTLIIRAIGYGPDNTRVVLEATISPIPLPAIVTNGDLEIFPGSVSIEGTVGSVHTNGALTMDPSASVLGAATASGAWNVPEGTPGTAEAAELPVPEIRAIDYLVHADFILKSDGTMTNPAGVLQCTWGPLPAPPCNNAWNFDDASDSWSVSGMDAPLPGTYYVQGDVSMSGDGTAYISIIAEGSINISGNRQLDASATKLLFVTDEDLELSDNVGAGLGNQGQMLVHEQVKLSGNAQLLGQLLVENAANVSSVVLANEISGNVKITYNGGLGKGVYSVTGWRDVRQ